MLQLEKPVVKKCYYIVHNWTMLVLDLMHIDEGNIGEKITYRANRNLRSMNKLENTLVLPYNEWSH
jgi:hypothetical protein